MAGADPVRFVRAALRSPGHIGAVAPSSAALSRAMLAGLDLTDGRPVLELGPGTGPFTRLIHQRIADPAAYLGIERDPGLARNLRRRMPALHVVCGSAEDAVEHLREAGHERVGTIVSGLPFASLPDRVQEGVFAALQRLMGPGTVFRTFQYVPSWPLPQAVRFRRRMRRMFGAPAVSRPVLRNLPPAIVLSWETAAGG